MEHGKVACVVGRSTYSYDLPPCN